MQRAHITADWGDDHSMTPTAAVEKVELPERIARLNDLAYNLWWTWSKPARQLFAELHPVLWQVVEQNPVLFLHRIEWERLERAAENDAFLADYDKVVAAFDAMINQSAGETWLAKNRPDLVGKTLAYFSAEFGLHRALPIYSGGLGVLAGDHTKEASDMGLPLVGISLLYRQGYLRQRIDSSGWQHDVAAKLDPHAEPTTQVFDDAGRPVLIEVDLEDGSGPLRLAVWQVQVGRVPIYLLDSDVEGNPEWTRELSSRLYGGDTEHRLRQEIVLGIGGVRLLRALGIDPAYWHANEGHAALLLLERVREHVASGDDFAKAAERVRASTIFTTHTPVPAGHDIFPPEMMDRYFSNYWPSLGLDRANFLALGTHGAAHQGFNFTALSLRLAGHVNGVSEKHGEVSRDMWADLWPDLPAEKTPIISITNGVHLRTWISPVMRNLYERYLPRNWRERQENPQVWETVLNIPDDEFWTAHLTAKQELIDEMDERARRRYAEGQFDAWQVLSSGPFQNANVMTLGFARRFATYKRATLIFNDMDRLARILNNPDHPVQLVFAGKAHPADEGGKRLIQEVYTKARDPRLGGRVAFAEDYEMGLASLLVAGVDVWLNNPIYPLEASGTSGMKAGANGVPNCSILDGWWIEGWEEGNANGWGIQPSTKEGSDKDVEEANVFYDILEREIVPLYYNRSADGLPHAWIALAKEAIRTIAPAFSSRRMLIDYVDRLYGPAAGAKVTANKAVLAPTGG
ncbi:MAG: Glycogen phosphorylase [uncultured Thermomicrobiales bacterium]|uniref:Glycogen phosphorylase n=1 Tax=uncultured Thermomicrobiales bacterium TaxID=1645740 RepID=A0A6J4UJW2_9BACT|nr:MAG: Glycogen phosphorylase [uncultured Thermomicrobiales bacterium]